MALKTYTLEELTVKGINPKVFKGHYSDAGFMIQKIGTTELYIGAIDLIQSTNEYIETDIPIETPTENEMGES